METRYRFWGLQKPPETRTPLLAADPTGTADSTTATLRIYAPIDSWGGEWGVSAPEMAQALDALPDTVKNINLHINSPGGEVFEGIAILNQLRAHPADVTVTVDGIAASAASFIAAGAGKTLMAPNSQMMIHDAWGVTVGNAADMQDMAGILDKLSNNIASVYADASSKGDTATWRAAMQAETWYTAEEAVNAGLATEVTGGQSVAANYDLTMFNYAGRAYAPAPGAEPPTPKFSDQTEQVITTLGEFHQRAQEVVTFRSEQGKSRLSERSVEQFDQIAALAEQILALRSSPKTAPVQGYDAFLAKETIT
jgi:ATP-dependent Clp endopeptidase proteolytic subunit ClpP